jgi:hypothetical protein
VENSLWKRLGTCRKTDYGTSDTDIELYVCYCQLLFGDYNIRLALESAYHTSRSLRFLTVFLRPTGVSCRHVDSLLMKEIEFLCHVIMEYQYSECIRTYENFVEIIFFCFELMLYKAYRLPVWNSGMADAVAKYHIAQRHPFY